MAKCKHSYTTALSLCITLELHANPNCNANLKPRCSYSQCWSMWAIAGSHLGFLLWKHKVSKFNSAGCCSDCHTGAVHVPMTHTLSHVHPPTPSAVKASKYFTDRLQIYFSLWSLCCFNSVVFCLKFECVLSIHVCTCALSFFLCVCVCDADMGGDLRETKIKRTGWWKNTKWKRERLFEYV